MIGRRVLAAVSGAALLVGLAIAPPVQQTDAAWVDPEYGSATFRTITLLPPVVEPLPGGLVCPNPLGTLLGGAALTIKWRWPSTTFTKPATSAFNVLLSGTIDGSGTTSTVAPGAATSGVYTTTVSKTLLEGLLGGLGLILAGGQYVVYFSTSWVTPGGLTWTSPQKVKITVTYPALLSGETTTCSSTVV
ncbi:hypothetical protein ACI3KS_05820 [Microbacterium sp. ZW T5_45]|uniref:hypothetical protein n=1 Tax=Microbacterium sp. ZW T5_45 TaxID=3378080 RepID=UPI00385211A1